MKKPKHRQLPTPPAEEFRPSFFSNTVLFSLVGILGALLGYAGWQNYQDNRGAPATTANDAPAANTAAASGTQKSSPLSPADAQKLRGQWDRGDDKFINIKSVGEDGKVDVQYLNPRPIHVAKAEAKLIDGSATVFVELQDVGYPGSTYDLRYDAANDQLVGEYFLAQQGQRIPVTFVRMK